MMERMDQVGIVVDDLAAVAPANTPGIHGRMVTRTGRRRR